MFAGKEKSDIFKIHSHGIIGGKEDHQRLFITQMGFGSHEYGGIRDAVCQLGKGISRTGGDEQKIQTALGPMGSASSMVRMGSRPARPLMVGYIHPCFRNGNGWSAHGRKRWGTARLPPV